ncbi:MAG: hypothetical protein SCJ93_13640, partial [Bacillota bacterium]|nr:hypothetical protein [Bacillota bacterium]
NNEGNYDNMNFKANQTNYDILELKNILKTMWKDKLNNIIDKKKQEASIIDLLEGTNYMNKLNNYFNEYKEKYPVKEVEYRLINNLIEDIDNNFQSLDLTDNIHETIKKIAREKASLADLDDEFFKWIKKNNYSNKIKISF